MNSGDLAALDVQARLAEILQCVEQGQSFYSTREGRRVAEIRPAAAEKTPLTRGCAKSEEYWMADDFND